MNRSTTLLLVLGGLAVLLAGAEAGCRQSSEQHDLPQWLTGQFTTDDGRLKLQFIDVGGRFVWYTDAGKYEELSWEAEGEKYWVLRPNGNGVERLGYVLKVSESTIVWHPARSPQKQVLLRATTRLSGAAPGPSVGRKQP